MKTEALDIFQASSFRLLKLENYCDGQYSLSTKFVFGLFKIEPTVITDLWAALILN